MDTVYINNMIIRMMTSLKQQLVIWIDERLHAITENWWQELVLDSLTVSQQEEINKEEICELSKLSLLHLLRILERNWFVITGKYHLNNRDRDKIRSMQEIYDYWSSYEVGEISKENAVDDVRIIISLMYSFGAEVRVVREMEGFLFELEEYYEDKLPVERTITENNRTVTGGADEKTTEEIKVGSIVTLVSDQSAIGAVIGINGNKYSVLINGSVQTYYKEQIQVKRTEEKQEFLPVYKARAAITAFQIHNPGSENLYSLNASRIDFVPYQFRPALRVIQSDMPKLLVADDVGVGKTIEAGIILKELEARSNLSSVLVICPRPLVAERKWQLEMKRFDEEFTQMDGNAFLECISETDRDGEWPERHSKTIIPYSLFSEDSILGRESSSKKKKKTAGLAELDPMPHFDMVIVDEAHNIRNPKTWAYRGVELFCRNADAVVFLTATPLQNSNDDLYTLLNLLRPDLITDKETFRIMAEPNVYVNRLLHSIRIMKDGWQEECRRHIAGILSTPWGRNVIQQNPDFEEVYNFPDKTSVSREERIEIIRKVESLHSFDSIINRTRRNDIEDFCIRRTQTVSVVFTETQKALYDALIAFESSALARLHNAQSVRFMMCTILRQASSCIYGLTPFLNDIISRRLVQIQEDGELFEYDFEWRLDDDDSIIHLSDEIIRLADALDDYDPKYEQMLEIIKEKQKQENNRIIIFSSFRHTLRYLHDKLKAEGFRVGQVDGSVSDDERYKLRQRFLMGRNHAEALDILLFSEVGSEGLDYQFCDTMINYDLPWNPMRIEQRIGRIDRRGQASESVKIYNLITKDTIDAVIYERCLMKIGVFEASIGDCSEILGDISDKLFNIMFDPGLNEAERQNKIEKMADNEVMKVQELHRLEQEEKTLYGFDLSKYVMDKDVQDAENVWINPQSMQTLLNVYLNDYLGDGEYIRGKQEGKTLRLSAEKRQRLLDALTPDLLPPNNQAARLWKAYLKSDKPLLQVTFDSQFAKDNRDIAFLTGVHPFVQQAARYESKDFPLEISVSTVGEDLQEGDYEFLIYAWRYVGLRPNTKLIPVCENELVENSILSVLQYAVDYGNDMKEHESNWQRMDGIHYERWQKERAAYIKEVQNQCRFRLEQLSQSHQRQEAIIRTQIETATESRIRRMRVSQLENSTKKYMRQVEDIKRIVSKADILTSLLIKGVLHIGNGKR